jgi:hypothetical protein
LSASVFPCATTIGAVAELRCCALFSDAAVFSGAARALLIAMAHARPTAKMAMIRFIIASPPSVA